MGNSFYKHTAKLIPFIQKSSGLKDSSLERHKTKMLTMERFNEKGVHAYSERSGKQLSSSLKKTRSVKVIATNFQNVNIRYKKAIIDQIS